MCFLEKVYDELDYSGGDLLPASFAPLLGLCEEEDWLDRGEWLSAAARAGAEKVFFVKGNPVVVFASVDSPNKIKQLFNRVWNMGRPRFLFISTDSDLSVFDLASRPTPITDADQKLKSLERITIAKDVLTKLQGFHRNNIESGKIFEDRRFGNIKNRADQTLIADLKFVRHSLMAQGLAGERVKYAHSLIGRSIFIRYLEDRGILSRDYFYNIAKENREWMDILSAQYHSGYPDLSQREAIYPKILHSKSFTYALFKRLSLDFNGDMFPNIIDEECVITQDHLRTIQSLLYGDTGVQHRLCFFTYQFDIIPLDLISAIYEEFYHAPIASTDRELNARQDGAYYTPPALAEFVVTSALPATILDSNPRIIDPACGSGIFLVESFRRIVRYKWHKNKSPLSFDELKNIALNQIRGIEVNEEAARVTAFSLYLAMLHYVSPPSILEQISKGNKLPPLIATGQSTAKTIWPGNAFQNLETSSLWDDFGAQTADVVICNPPWGSLSKKDADDASKLRERVMLSWCGARRPISDKEPSQAFLWKSIELLKQGGRGAMLVPAGVIFKQSDTSKKFRREWLKNVCLKEVFNFTHVRRFFFKESISPFILVVFSKESQAQNKFKYWSAKQSAAVKETRSVLLSNLDRAILSAPDDDIWKTYFFGGHHDYVFIKQLSPLQRLKSLCANVGAGFKRGNRKHEIGWLSEFKFLPTKHFAQYGAIAPGILESLSGKFEHHGKNKELYSGNRIYIKEGISKNGYLLSRVVDENFCVNDSIYSLKLRNEDYLEVVSGILWSSFARYYLFMTSGSWINYHDKVLLNDILNLPIPHDLTGELGSEVANVARELRAYNPTKRSLSNITGDGKAAIDLTKNSLESKLNESVYKLYNLSDEHRDLVEDFNDITLPFFYSPYDNIGVQEAVSQNLTSAWIGTYLHAFSRRWKPYLNANEELRADIHVGADGAMLAIEFYPADCSDPWILAPQVHSWSYVLGELGNAMAYPINTSILLMEGVLYSISDNSIIVVKRNHKRFWSRSCARSDADTLLAKSMMVDLGRTGGH